MTMAVTGSQIDNEIVQNQVAQISVAIKTHVLNYLLKQVASAAAKTSVLEIQKYIYLHFDEKRLTAKAFNSDFTIESFIDQDEKQENFKIMSGQPSSLCFPAALLTNLTNQLKGKNTFVEIQETHAVFTCGKRKLEIRGLEGSQFPISPTLEKEMSLTVTADTLIGLYQSTAYAASSSESRPILTSINHHIFNDSLIVSATDSKLVSRSSVPIKKGLPERTANLPASTAKHIEQLLRGGSNDVDLHFCNQMLAFEFNGTILYSRLLEGNYPNIETVVSSSLQNSISITMPVGQFKDAVDATSLIQNSEAGTEHAEMIMIPELKQFRVIKHSKDIGSFKEDMNLTDAEGQSLRISAHLKSISDSLKSYPKTGLIQLNFNAQMSPIVFHMKGDRDSHINILAPVRTYNHKEGDSIIIEDFADTSYDSYDPFASAVSELDE